MKFEHKVAINPSPSSIIQSGIEGWELVAVIYIPAIPQGTSAETQAYYKRPVDQEAAIKTIQQAREQGNESDC